MFSLAARSALYAPGTFFSLLFHYSDRVCSGDVKLQASRSGLREMPTLPEESTTRTTHCNDIHTLRTTKKRSHLTGDKGPGRRTLPATRTSAPLVPNSSFRRSVARLQPKYRGWVWHLSLRERRERKGGAFCGARWNVVLRIVQRNYSTGAMQRKQKTVVACRVSQEDR